MVWEKFAGKIPAGKNSRGKDLAGKRPAWKRPSGGKSARTRPAGKRQEGKITAGKRPNTLFLYNQFIFRSSHNPSVAWKVNWFRIGLVVLLYFLGKTNCVLYFFFITWLYSICSDIIKLILCMHVYPNKQDSVWFM